MKRIYQLAFVMLIVVLSCFVTGYATSTYEEKDILDGVALYKSLDFTEIATDEVTSYGSDKHLETWSSGSLDGLKIEADDTGINYYFDATCFDFEFGVSGAVKVTFMRTGSADLEMEIASPTSGQRIRFFPTTEL